eukprot:COSAG01_NODE_2192_length_8185_cov_66.560846_1_plen_51_part_00
MKQATAVNLLGVTMMAAPATCPESQTVARSVASRSGVLGVLLAARGRGWR